MPPLHLAIHPDPRTLLDAAADAEHGYRMDDILLALRQGGIRDDLYRLAGDADHPGWFDPPVCVFHELPERLGIPAANSLNQTERIVLLERLMRRHGAPVLDQPPFVDALDNLLGELLSEAITPDQLDAAATSAVVFEDWDRERNQAIARIYRALVDALHGDPTGPRYDGRELLHVVADSVRRDPETVAKALNGRTEIRIVGLTDLRGGWRRLLEELRTSPAISRVVIHALNGHLLAEGLEPDEVIGSAASGPPNPNGLRLVHAPDTDREVEEIAVRIRHLLDTGVAPHRIAVVSRKARPHVDLMLVALERVGVPATARRRISHREIPVVRSILALLRAAGEGWTRHGLSELAAQPYFANALDTRVLDLLGFRQSIVGLENWQAALEALLAEARRREAGEEPEDGYRGWQPSVQRAAEALDQFLAFSKVAGSLQGSRSLSDWIKWMEGFLADDPWQMQQQIRCIPEGAWEMVRVDLAGWQALHDLLGEWRGALDYWEGGGAPLDAMAFLAEFSTVLTGDIALWTTCRHGVQVLEGLSAAYRGFDHLFLVGLEAGSFPTTRPRSPILHEEDRAALHAAGVPFDLDQVWEARERTLFNALLTGAPNITLSRPTLDASGREVIGSAYLNELDQLPTEVIPASRVLTPGLPLVPDSTTASHALRTARIEADRETRRLSPWNGRIEDPELRALVASRYGEQYHWSPTQLETFAQCPWRWFSARLLGLEQREEPSQEMEPSVRGTIWHAALEEFWSRATSQMDRLKRTGEGRLLRAPDLEWARPMLSAAFYAAWEAQGDIAWLGHPALHAATRQQLEHTLQRYLEWEVELNEKAYASNRGKAPTMLRTAVESHELPFSGITLDRNGVRFVYRGMIDRVEVGVDARVPSQGFVAAIDYKSSIYSTPGGGSAKAWEDGVVLQVPLYAHALTQLRPGTEVARVEYRAIRQQKQAHTLELAKVKNLGKSPTLERDEKAADKLDAALDAAAARVGKVRSAEFPADYTDSCKCSPYCQSWDICRVAGGPQKAGR